MLKNYPVKNSLNFYHPFAGGDSYFSIEILVGIVIFCEIVTGVLRNDTIIMMVYSHSLSFRRI